MRDIQDKTDGTGDILAAAAFNTNLINELQDFVVSAGFTLDPEAGPDTDTAMFSKSVCNYSVGAMYFSESGAADAYVLTRSGNVEALSSYFDGAMVCFNPGNDNTGASTINVDGLGVKDLVAADGTALTGGEVVADIYCIARYNSSTDDFEVVKSAGDDAATLNGLASDTAATADTIAARDSSGDITANAFESTVATGTAPLTVASTTVVTNLNADLFDGQQATYYATLSTDQTFTGAKIIGDLYGTIGSTSILTVATTLTPAQMDSKVIRIGTAATETVTMTLPTEADMEAYFTGMDDFTTFEISICNEDDTFTGVIANSDFAALIGNMTIATESSACFLVRRTSATSWLIYRKAG